MTPDSIYESVKNWVLSHYNLPDDTIIVRLFWPGADYAAYPYNGDELVLDNPPFSILAKILDFYNARGIRYFLFAPGLMCFNHIGRSHVVLTGSTVTYANGARVNTAFCTNLPGPELLLSAELAKAIAGAKWKVPKTSIQEFPPNVWNSARISRLVKRGISFEAQKVEKIANLDLGGGKKYHIFGGGVVLSPEEEHFILPPIRLF